MIANCVSEENQFFEEWVLYNDVARLHQCGIDVRAAAREYGNSGASLPLGERELTEIERLHGGRPPERYPAATGTGFDVDHFVRALFQDTYNRRDLSAIDRAYVPNVRWHGGSLREGYGRADVRKFARGLMATFPDLGLHVDEVYWMGNEAEGFSVSVRWTRSAPTAGTACTARRPAAACICGASTSSTSATAASSSSGRCSTSSTCWGSCCATETRGAAPERPDGTLSCRTPQPGGRGRAGARRTGIPRPRRRRASSRRRRAGP